MFTHTIKEWLHCITIWQTCETAMGGCNKTMAQNMNKCLWKGSRNECESWPYCRGCTWPKKIFKEWGQNCKLPDVWGMISHVRASFSKDWMGNAAKSVTLWASRQNGLLVPWLIVAYALCTTLADHPDTQLIVQITRLCPRCKAKVKVVAPWQTAYYVLMLEPLCSDVKATMFWC